MINLEPGNALSDSPFGGRDVATKPENLVAMGASRVYASDRLQGTNYLDNGKYQATDTFKRDPYYRVSLDGDGIKRVLVKKPVKVEFSQALGHTADSVREKVLGTHADGTQDQAENVCRVTDGNGKVVAEMSDIVNFGRTIHYYRSVRSDDSQYEYRRIYTPSGKLLAEQYFKYKPGRNWVVDTVDSEVADGITDDDRKKIEESHYSNPRNRFRAADQEDDMILKGDKYHARAQDENGPIIKHRKEVMDHLPPTLVKMVREFK